MRTPVATADDLATFLGVTFDSTDTTRATQLLGWAQDLCETIISPLPTTAAAVVIGVAARAFVNPQQYHDTHIGQAGFSFAGQSQAAVGGLFLSRADKANLRRLAGSGGAFGVDTLPVGTLEVQTVTVTATGGTFVLSFNGASTGALAYNVDAATMQAALTALQSVGAGNLTVALPTAGNYVVTFTYPGPRSLLVADGSALTGGSVTVAETTPGVLPPASRQPYWDRDYFPTVSPVWLPD